MHSAMRLWVFLKCYSLKQMAQSITIPLDKVWPAREMTFHCLVLCGLLDRKAKQEVGARKARPQGQCEWGERWGHLGGGYCQMRFFFFFFFKENLEQNTYHVGPVCCKMLNTMLLWALLLIPILITRVRPAQLSYLHQRIWLRKMHFTVWIKQTCVSRSTGNHRWDSHILAGCDSGEEEEFQAPGIKTPSSWQRKRTLV